MEKRKENIFKKYIFFSFPGISLPSSLDDFKAKREKEKWNLEKKNTTESKKIIFKKKKKQKKTCLTSRHLQGSGEKER